MRARERAGRRDRVGCTCAEKGGLEREKRPYKGREKQRKKEKDEMQDSGKETRTMNEMREMAQKRRRATEQDCEERKNKVREQGEERDGSIQRTPTEGEKEKEHRVVMEEE